MQREAMPSADWVSFYEACMEDEEVAVVEGEGEAQVTAVADEVEEEEVDVVMGTEVQASTDTRIVMFDHFAPANLTSEGLKAWF